VGVLSLLMLMCDTHSTSEPTRMQRMIMDELACLLLIAEPTCVRMIWGEPGCVASHPDAPGCLWRPS